MLRHLLRNLVLFGPPLVVVVVLVVMMVLRAAYPGTEPEDEKDNPENATVHVRVAKCEDL